MDARTRHILQCYFPSMIIYEYVCYTISRINNGDDIICFLVGDPCSVDSFTRLLENTYDDISNIVNGNNLHFDICSTSFWSKVHVLSFTVQFDTKLELTFKHIAPVLRKLHSYPIIDYDISLFRMAHDSVALFLSKYKFDNVEDMYIAFRRWYKTSLRYTGKIITIDEFKLALTEV